MLLTKIHALEDRLAPDSSDLQRLLWPEIVNKPALNALIAFLQNELWYARWPDLPFACR